MKKNIAVKISLKIVIIVNEFDLLPEKSDEKKSHNQSNVILHISCTDLAV